jgi:hypothetical protein
MLGYTDIRERYMKQATACVHVPVDRAEALEQSPLRWAQFGDFGEQAEGLGRQGSIRRQEGRVAERRRCKVASGGAGGRVSQMEWRGCD